MTVRRSLLVVAVLVGGLVAVAAGFAGWLLYTDSGARWALGVAVDATDEAFAYDDLDGSLAGGLRLTGIRYEIDTVEVQLDELEASIDVDVLPPGVTVESPQLTGLAVNVVVSHPESSDSTVDLATLLESLALPVPVAVTELAISDIAISVNNEPVVALDRLEFSAAWQDRIELTGLELGSAELSASTDAQLELARPFELSVSAAAVVSPQLTGLPDPIDAAATMAGTLDRIDLELRENTNGVEIGGQVSNLLGGEPRWDLAAAARSVEVPIDADLRLDNLALRTTGWLDGYEFSSSLAVIANERIDLSLEGSGSLDGIDFADLTARHEAGTFKVNGRLDFPVDFNGTVRVSNGRPGQVLEALPPNLGLEASARIRASERYFEVTDGRVAAGGASASIAALVDLEREELSADIDWQNLHWPLGNGSPDIVSTEGLATIKGNFAEWAAEANARLEPKGLPEGRFRVLAAGSKDYAEVDIAEGDILGGSLDGAAEINWGDAPSWSLDVNAEAIATGALMPTLPGSISASLKARSLEELASARIELGKLEGILLDEPVSGSGTLELSAVRAAAERLELVHGDSRLELDGDLRSAEGLQFDIVIVEVSDYSPELSGDFSATGSLVESTIEGGISPILLDMTAGSESLRFGDLAVNGLKIEASQAADAQQVSASVLDLRVGERQLGDLDLDLRLNPDQQALALTVQPLNHTLRIGIAGSFNGEPGASPWRGSLDEFTLTTPGGTEARLADSSSLVLSGDRVEIGRFCVASDAGESLCSALAWSDAGALSVSAEANELPLAVLDALLQTGFSFEQRLSGNVAWRRAVGQLPTGGANIRFTGGEISSDDYPELDLRTDPGVFAFEVEDGALLSGELDLPLPGTGFLKGSFLLSDVGLGVSSPVQGALAAEINDVEVFAALLPDVDDAAGQLQANLTLEGTVSEPIVLGDAALIGATLTYFPLGLKLEEINLDGTIDARQRIDLNGRFRAGEGIAVVQSSRDSAEDANPGLHFEIRGDNLTVVDLPDVSAIANADLKLDFRDNRLDLDGRVDIPYARIMPRNLATARVDESGDVVIVEGELPDAPPVDEEKADLEVFGKLSLGIGDDVEVLLDVARAELSGNTDFEWSGDLIPYGNGRYDLVGTVQAFGQVLNITEGGVRFPNVPADNPNIRIRATREIFGNSQIKRAGILVDGSAARPTIEAYTIPLTTEERALALLLTGNDFDLEQGVGAIDFGTYIAPRLFLSYGVGVFARENIISARYDLARGFGVRVTSGTRDSGADLTYRIER